MGWSKTASLVPGQDQKKIRIKTKHGEMALINIEQQQIGHTVSVSRGIVAQVIGLLAWPTASHRARVHAHMARYFLTDAAGPSRAEVETVLKKLELVMNGINNKINVKVAPDDSAYGYVGFKTGVTGFARGLFSSRHNLGTRGGKIVSRGDIHIDRDTLDDAELSIITFIHEATHKYASTADHGDSGYLDNSGLQFDAPGLTKKQALNNADSYAWFCYAAYYR